MRIEGTPINPSDLGLSAWRSRCKDRQGSPAPATLQWLQRGFRIRDESMAGRLDESMPVGNEGAGVVVKAGASDAAQALLGKTVAIIGGAMYAQYRCLKAADCLCCRRERPRPKAPPASSIR